MASFGGSLARNKERLLFAASVAALIGAVCWMAAWEAGAANLPDEPRLPPPKPAGAVMGADQLFSSGQLEDYWNDGARHVFVQPAPVRVFKPVALEVPTISPPRPPMPLPDPGPFLQNTGTLPRLGDSTALSASASGTGTGTDADAGGGK